MNTRLFLICCTVAAMSLCACNNAGKKGDGDQEQLVGRPGITAEEICKNWNHFSNLGKQGAKL